MVLKRARVVLALSMVSLVAACGGGGGASAAPGTTQAAPVATGAPVQGATPAATDAASEAPTQAATASAAPPAAGGPGTLTVTVGDRTVSTRIFCQGDASGLIVMSAGDSSDVATVLMSSAGLTTASGTIAGVDFGVMPGGTASTDGKSGSFSGTDAGTDLAVSGSFTCP